MAVAESGGEDECNESFYYDFVLCEDRGRGGGEFTSVSLSQRRNKVCTTFYWMKWLNPSQTTSMMFRCGFWRARLRLRELASQAQVGADSHKIKDTMASMTTNNSIKRRNTDGTLAACLGDLPIGILEHTASFLAAPSRALFAIALATEENNNPPGENYSSIAGADDWDTLDFGEIEKDLAARLSDDDISDILQHIDAVNNVKRLRLTHCTNITGIGLMPLLFSTTIEQIDLSLTGDGESPRRLDPEPPISCGFVLPILDSIIEQEDCAIKHLQFPYKWRKDRSAESVFHGFILRYNQMWENRDTVACPCCDADLPESGLDWIRTQDSEWYGTQNYLCYQCTNHYCYDCEEDGNRNFAYCDQCQRDYCKNCVKVDHCERCGENFCEHCSSYKECDECNGKFCSGCTETFTVCIYCGVSYCNDCTQISDGFTISLCNDCNEYGCDDCRLRRCQEGSSDCDGCIESLPQDTLVAQFKIQQEKVRHLENEVRKLELENKELKDKQRNEEKTSTE
jgi:hypothetical protein